VVDWTTAPEADVVEPYTHISYGWATQVVILDDEGRLARVVAAQDVGRAINRQLVEGQVEGGVHMGRLRPSEAFDTDAAPRPTPARGSALPPGMVEVTRRCPQPDGPFERRRRRGGPAPGRRRGWRASRLMGPAHPPPDARLDGCSRRCAAPGPPRHAGPDDAACFASP
jgi:hypothetical protein